MSNVITVDQNVFRQGKIDLDILKASQSRRLSENLIAPAEENIEYEVAPEHAADPIKSLDDIERVSKFLIQNKRYRDNMLFIVGINFGLRVSDLRVLRFGNLINDNLTFKDSFAVLEKKTKNTRKHKKNRYITINTAVIEAVTLYLEHTKDVCLSDYMFKSESRNGSNLNRPITIRAINQMLKKLAEDLGLNMHVSTHTLRKTFCYHQMVMSNNDHRKLLLLQKMLNHSSPAQTLDYIGITGEEIEEAYKNLNLGSKSNYLVNSSIIELDEKVG